MRTEQIFPVLLLTFCACAAAPRTQTVLPRLADLNACRQPAAWVEQTPEIWVLSADAVIIGRVTDVRPLLAPARVHGNRLGRHGAVVGLGECQGPIQGGIEVDLDRVQVLSGSAPPALRLAFGYTAVSGWSPKPETCSACPGVPWTGEPGGRIEPGQWIGGAIALDPSTDSYTTDGTALFIDGGDGVLAFQEGFSCDPGYPATLQRVTLSDLGSILAGLHPTEQDVAATTHRRERRWARASAVDDLVLAVCHEEGGPQPECIEDSQCGPGETCLNEVCTPAPAP